LGTLIKIQEEIGLKCNCRERKGEENIKTQQAYFQAENHTDEDSDVWKQFLYWFSTEPVTKTRT